MKIKQKIIFFVIIIIYCIINFDNVILGKKKVKIKHKPINASKKSVSNNQKLNSSNIKFKNNKNKINKSSIISKNKNISHKRTLKIVNDIYINPYFKNEKKSYKYFLSLKKMPKDMNSSIIEKEKNDIYENITNNIGMNITSLNEIYFNTDNRFGNELIILNKLIFYCEIMNVHKIIINKDNNLYINNTIYDKQYNLTIEVNNGSNTNNDINNYNLNDDHFVPNDDYIQQNNPEYNSGYTFSNYFPNLFFIFFNLRIENRFGIFKNEILKNLPKVKINSNDLYIHIRGGDIFKDEASNPGYASSYAQFPLCFYSEIIEKNRFRKIYIISEDRLNPVLNKLINKYKYKNITYNKNSLELDISYLAHAYKIVGSVSSFITSIIKLNDNLKYFWEYDIYQMEHKLYHMHHSIYDFPRNYTIYRMEPSEKYKKEMYIWTRNKTQIDIMLNDKCPNRFKTIEPNN